MVLGQVISVEPIAVELLDERQPIPIERLQGDARQVLDVIEDAEFHQPASPSAEGPFDTESTIFPR